MPYHRVSTKRRRNAEVRGCDDSQDTFEGDGAPLRSTRRPQIVVSILADNSVCIDKDTFGIYIQCMYTDIGTGQFPIMLLLILMCAKIRLNYYSVRFLGAILFVTWMNNFQFVNKELVDL